MKPALWCLILAACTTTSSVTTETLPSTTSPTRSTTTTTEVLGVPGDATYKEDLVLSVHHPGTRGDWPVVVMVHGGGWVGGDHLMMEPLAEDLAAQGVVVFNGDYRTLARGGGHPQTFEDVACLVATARALAPDYTDRGEAITLLGYSAGAHLAAVVSLSDNRFATDCPVEADSRPQRFVGLAGPYDPKVFGLLLTSFFGARLDEDPTPWEEGSPYTYLEGNSDLAALLVHGSADEVVFPSFTTSFAAGLEEAGHEVEAITLPGVDHIGIRSPEVVGELVAEFADG